MKAEYLYHTGIVVDDLDATMEWFASWRATPGPTSSTVEQVAVKRLPAR